MAYPVITPQSHPKVHLCILGTMIIVITITNIEHFIRRYATPIHINTQRIRIRFRAGRIRNTYNRFKIVYNLT